MTLEDFYLGEIKGGGGGGGGVERERVLLMPLSNLCVSSQLIAVYIK